MIDHCDRARFSMNLELQWSLRRRIFFLIKFIYLWIYVLINKTFQNNESYQKIKFYDFSPK